MADSELAHTHPATVIVGALKTLWQGLFAALGFALIGAFERGGSDWLLGVGAAGFVLLLSAVGAGFSFLKWHFFRYGIVGEDLLISEGWLVRKRRTIPLSRVQGVDVRAGVVMRVLGVTDVVVQTAGGGSGEAEAKIGQITLAEAEQLRFALLHGRQAVEPLLPADTGGSAVTSALPTIGADPMGRMADLRGAFGGVEAARVEPTFEYRVSLGRLVLSAATSRSVLIAAGAIIAGATQLLDFAGDDVFDQAGRLASGLGIFAIVAFTFLVILSALAIGAIVTISRNFGFTVRRVGDRVETEAGLLERRMTGMPVRRIQAVAVEESPLRRWLGWASVRAVTAGFGAGEEQQIATAPALVPIARRSEVALLLHQLLPEAERFPQLGPLPRRAQRFYLTVPTTLTVLFAAAILYATFAWYVRAAPGVLTLAVLTLLAVVGVRVLSWRNAAFGTDQWALGIQSGVAGRRRVRIGRNRIQSLSVRQNPFQRRAGLATVHAVGVSGSARAHYRIAHLEESDARRLLAWFSQRTPVSRTDPTQGAA